MVERKEYRNSEHTVSQWLVDKLRSEKANANSASIAKGELIDAVRRMNGNHDILIHVLMSNTLSQASFSGAEDTKEMFRDEVDILSIDSIQASSGVGVVLLRVLKVLKESTVTDSVLAKRKKIVDNTFSLFAFPDLGYLQRVTGRIGKAKALMGSVLNIILIVLTFKHSATTSHIRGD